MTRSPIVSLVLAIAALMMGHEPDPSYQIAAWEAPHIAAEMQAGYLSPEDMSIVLIA